MNRFRKGLLVFALLVFFLVGSYYSSLAQKMQSVSVLSDEGMGLSFFNSLAHRLNLNKVRYLKKPLLKIEELNGVNLYAILSPKSPISEHETSLLSEYVKNGGHLLVSFHARESSVLFKQLFKKLGIEISTSLIEDFENDSTATRTSEITSPLLAEGKTYELYSNFTLTDEQGISSYIKTYPIGSGNVSIIAGLPPFSNAMITRHDNRFMAYQMLKFQSILFDEYQHFFSDKTVWELFMEPTFFLPIFGMIITAILFFLFGRVSRNEAFSELPPLPPASSYHMLNERVLSGIAYKLPSRYDLFVYHGEMLKRLFPDEQARIDALLKRSPSTRQDMQFGKDLLTLHQKILSERMGNDIVLPTAV